MKHTTKKRIAAKLVMLPLLASVYCQWPPEQLQIHKTAVGDGCPAEAGAGDNLGAIDDLYFNKDCASVGSYRIGMSDADWLATRPGFEYYEGHRGGYGDTLEIINRKAGMYLKWAYNRLQTINVFEGWQGETAGTGMRLESTLEEFLAAYPTAVPYDCRPFCQGNPNFYAIEIYKSGCEEINAGNSGRSANWGYRLQAGFDQYRRIAQFVIRSVFYFCDEAEP